MFIRWNQSTHIYEKDTSAGSDGTGPWIALPLNASILNEGNLDVARMPLGGTWALTSGITLTGAFTFNIPNDIKWSNNTGFGLVGSDSVRFLSYTTAGGVSLGAGATGVLLGTGIRNGSGTTSCLTGTATSLLGVGGPRLYIFYAYIAALNYNAYCVFSHDGTQANLLVTNSNTANFVLSRSGSTIQVTQLSGSTQTVTYNYFIIGVS